MVSFSARVSLSCNVSFSTSNFLALSRYSFLNFADDSNLLSQNNAFAAASLRTASFFASAVFDLLYKLKFIETWSL